MTDNKLEKLAEIRNYINDVLCFPLFNFEQLYAMVVLRFDIPDDEAKKITWEYILEKARIGYTLPLLEEVKREERERILKELENNHPYRETIFPRTAEWSAQLERNKGLTDDEITGVSGALCRMGYNAALFTLKRYIENFEEGE